MQWLDLTLTQIEKAVGLPVGRIGIEAQIENAAGLVNVDAIAAASPRIETIIFGPADFMASINMKSLVVGALIPDYPGDPYHYILMRILMAARMHDLQAIDGPFLQIRDVDAFREVAKRSAALGFDGKWVLHPGQIEAANEVYAPAQDDYDHAELILDAYEHSTSEAGGKLGAVMLGDEMIDEASRKMALVIAAKGRAAGLDPHLPVHAAGGLTSRAPIRAYGSSNAPSLAPMTIAMTTNARYASDQRRTAIQPTMMPASAMPSPSSPRSRICRRATWPMIAPTAPRCR